MKNQMSLFEVEFQDYIFSQFKNLPIPKTYLRDYQKKAKKNIDGLQSGDDHFWLRKDQKLQSQFESMFGTLLNPAEMAYFWESIPKIAIPLTNAEIARREFANPLVLFKIMLDKRLAALYEQIEIDCHGKIGSFTWVMPDGYGDWIAQKKGIEMLKKGQPNLEIKSLTFYESSWKALIEDSFINSSQVEMQFVAYPKEKPSKAHTLLAEQFNHTMHGVQWLLEFPTHYVGLPDLLKTRSIPLEILGQYGFLLAPPFSPGLTGKSMGLHPFEVGILLREEGVQEPPARLLKGDHPYDAMTLAYLKTKRGAEAYLFLIAALRAKQAQKVAIMMPTFACLEKSLEDDQLIQDLSATAKGKILFLRQDGRKIEYGEGIVCLQVIEIGPCTEEELLSLAAHSRLPIGCRGDQSFTEAISLKKPFFYDPPAHAGNFLIDLAKFAQFHTSSERLKSWFEGSTKVLFDEDPSEIGKNLAALYSDFESLSRDFCALRDQIGKFANANHYLRGRLKRIFLHAKHPSLKVAENELYQLLSNVVRRNQIDHAALKFWSELRKNFELGLQLKIYTKKKL